MLKRTVKRFSVVRFYYDLEQLETYRSEPFVTGGFWSGHFPRTGSIEENRSLPSPNAKRLTIVSLEGLDASSRSGVPLSRHCVIPRLGDRSSMVLGFDKDRVVR
jgi:hypothetical protein